jgi:serine/threonine protein kinase
MAESQIILGKYELLEVIGDGAEGRVYKAVCIAEGVPGVARGCFVALKRLKSMGHDKESEQFRRQIDILRKLNHPNIVGYKDSFVWREKELVEDVYCLVMELLDGETLKQLLSRHRDGLPWKDAKGIFEQVLLALQYTIKSGVVHRDLKPSNIHIISSGTPKLVDFGIARQDDGEATATSSGAGAKGSFDFMAPDFARMHGGFRGDEQSDIFSFGVLFYNALSGRLPFPPLGENASRDYYIRWLGQSPPSADFKHPVFRVLPRARTCIARCIEPDREARYRSFDEVIAEFSRIGYRQLKHGAETYEFVEWLGKGGFGEVYRARRASDGREVAIKRLFSTGQSARFVREAKILREKSHPNLTEYVDFVEVSAGVDEREYYLILEYLEGMPGASLRDRIKASESGLDPGEALQLFISYLACLEHLHRNGIIHRDIKPGNLYAPANNPKRAKIFDLGIAHDEEGTRTHGQVPGTLDYMPPEFAMQSSGRGSAQSDLYSLGVTLYFALTKKLPFPRLPEREADAWVAFIRRAEKPLECAFDHPAFTEHPELVPLLRRSLASDPKRRPESAKAMGDEIAGILEGWGKREVFAAALAAGQKALERQDFAEAEKQAGRALELMPREAEGKQLLQKTREARRRIYTAALEAARTALAREDYDEVERQVARALEQAPSDKEAQQLLSKAKEARLRSVSDADADEAPTVASMPPAVEDRGDEPGEEATAETRPADLEKIIEFQKAAEREAKKKEQAAKPEPLPEEGRRAPSAAPARRGKAVGRIAIVAAGLAVAVGGYFGWQSLQQTRHQEDLASQAEQAGKYREAMDEGRAAYGRADYDTAIARAEAALKEIPGDAAAAKLRSDALAVQAAAAARAERERKYQEAMEAGRAAYSRADYGVAIERTEAALAEKFGDAAAVKLRSDARAAQADAAARADREKKYGEAMEAGRAAYDRGDYGTAIERAEAALGEKFGDTAAVTLRSNARTRVADAAARAEREKKYRDAMEAGREALGRADYDTAIERAGAALAEMPDDAAAVKLGNDARAAQSDAAAHADREKRYGEAMEAGRAAYGRADYDAAIDRADTALAALPGDEAATKLKGDAQARKAEIAARADRERKYQAAMEAGRAAYDRADYDTAIDRADAALAERFGDPAAGALRSDAQARKAEIALRAERERKYQAAMAAGRTALGRHDFGVAIEQADAALANRTGDAEATALRADAQTQLDAALERERNYQAAMAEGRSDYSQRHFGRARVQAALALGIKPGDPEATKLGKDAQRQLDRLPPRNPLRDVLGVTGFNFVWVPNLEGGDGAYVETTELSQSQYDSLAGKFGLASSKMRISGTSDGDPANLGYEDAVRLAESLTKEVQGPGPRGQFQLPSRRDVLLFSGVVDSTDDPNPTFQSLEGLFSRSGANIGGSHPRGTGEGSPNKFGLFNALGNAWEWCDDQSGAGFEYDSTFGSLFRPHRNVQGLYTGGRFIFVPSE